ncbi:two-component system, OmpR family, sensor histidine kinase BaeS [Dokdonella immobilis]|uniref:Signal transduction histidine-protein kinase/phosphatase MprB n=1 Tax=Dokdonella immobilis TaxID=578942 RepID=A0A1I4X6I7_9GAMM|nr:two-component system, OmpR family, sensor histidine kinase BaeS [Dokdonella immobilis]
MRAGRCRRHRFSPEWAARPLASCGRERPSLLCLDRCSGFRTWSDPPLRLPIGLRLFATIASAILILAAIGLQLIRWSVFDGSGAPRPTADVAVLDQLANDLEQRYREHGGWTFVPPATALQASWMREQVRRAMDARHDAEDPLPGLGTRIALLDRHEDRIAGLLARRVVVAFASIDTIRRTLMIDGEVIGHLVLAEPGNPDDALAVAFLIERQDRLLCVLLAGILLSAVLAALLADHFRRPIRRLLESVRQFERGRFEARSGVHRTDELGELANAFDRMAARLAEVEAMRKRWVADTSHELRTPVAVLRAQLESMQDGIRSATPANIDLLLRQVGALGHLVDALHALSLGDECQSALVAEPCDLWSILRETSDAFSERARAAGLLLETRTPREPGMVLGDAEQLRRLLANLIENSIRHTAAGGRIDVCAHTDADELHVVVDDSAPGVAEADRARLGERFFRVDPSRHRNSGGSGLGLALARQIVTLHGGRIEFAESPQGGLRVSVVLHRP